MDGMLLTIPEKLENLQLPAPELLTFYQDEKNRTLWIEGEICDSLWEYTKLILKYNREDLGKSIEERKPIKIFINSPGGNLDETLAFAGMIGISKTPVWTINTGWCYSAAGLILMSGHKRFAMPNSQALIHSGSGGTMGTYEQNVEQMKNYKALVDKMKTFILSKTKIDAKLFKKNSTKDWYISTEEMLEFGIVDTIVEDMDVLF